PSIPKVTAFLSLRVGNGAMHQQQPGLPALAAEIINEGTQTRSSRQIQEELRSIGASLTTGTDDDSTQVRGSTLSEFTEKYLSLMSDVVRNPSFPDEEVTLAKQNTIQNIQAMRASPNFLGNERLRKAIFGDHPYSFVVADKSSIEKITTADLKKFVSDYYVPNNAHLILVGSIQPADAFSIAQKVFGSWKAKEVPAEELSDPVKRDRRQIYFVHRPGSVQSDISVGIATFPRKDGDYFAARTADTIFGGGSSSRLVQNIREKRGYTYSPFSVNFTMAKSGLFTVNAPVRNEVTGLTLVEIFYELDRLRIAEPTQQELADAKMKQNGNFSVELASQSDLAGRIDTIY
ncbi:MAG TPA: pitrilysin family protein, partial [Acidobacteriota bacterium]|nr:pitrilysin family protein [Acidobacteriota bacterium]